MRSQYILQHNSGRVTNKRLKVCTLLEHVLRHIIMHTGIRRTHGPGSYNISPKEWGVLGKACEDISWLAWSSNWCSGCIRGTIVIFGMNVGVIICHQFHFISCELQHSSWRYSQWCLPTCHSDTVIGDYDVITFMALRKLFARNSSLGSEKVLRNML